MNSDFDPRPNSTEIQYRIEVRELDGSWVMAGGSFSAGEIPERTERAARNRKFEGRRLRLVELTTTYKVTKIF
jgi:hypothetical protein